MRILGMILAGGIGKRLWPLTKDRAKPAVPFGGQYRIIDFVLNNFINSNIFRLKVLTQFKSDSLIRHIGLGYRMSRSLDQYCDVVPAQMRTGERWYEGTADAIYQNLNTIIDISPDIVAVFGGDHIYKMDIQQMLDFHISKDADLTISAIPRKLEEASSFGVIQTNRDDNIVGFQEKPKNPTPIPSRIDMAYISMGNYLFNKEILVRMLRDDEANKDSSHDFGNDIIPMMVKEGHRVFAYDFTKNEIPNMTEQERGYWRDVGTIDAYYSANMDLRSVSPVFNLYNAKWPIRTAHSDEPPAKFVFADYGERCGIALDSLVSHGCIISGALVQDSIVSPGVFIHSYSEIKKSIIMQGVQIGRNCRIQNAIIDKAVKIPPETIIGFDKTKDKKKFTVSPEGIVVIPKNYRF
ncbi:MAG: glucose-1-phosphate adenylyltransferase [Candidatus Coatesbacteria bacterium]|nr:glucose-1-phosphate adenylyltransferase [Candidatus Coatesbacteria bacterium]